MLSQVRTSSERFKLASDGAQLVGGALGSIDLIGIIGLLKHQPADQAGVRLFGVPGLEELLQTTGLVGRIAASFIGDQARPVRAILFDKTASTNWSLAWHQDRVIAVQERVDVEGFGPWSRKHGALHVAPPFDLLSQMITMRVHLDPVPENNAPLLIAPGSHRRGRIPEPDVPRVVDECGVAACLAEPGDVWVYSTPILHASERASAPMRRRVLQVDYATGELPGGLRWLGV